MRTGLLLLVLITACTTSDGSHVVSFHDQASRACTVDVADISATATCDVDPSTLTTCASGTTPCFNVGPDPTQAVLQNCAACCQPSTHNTFIDGTTCAPITCTTNADCVYDNVTCGTDGTCQYP